MLLLAQAATVTVPIEGAADCAGSSADIVVCGRRTDQHRYRLPPAADERVAGPPAAEWSLGGGVRAGFSASQSPLPQGATSPRVMATMKIPF